jgi:hypothetical protein
MFRYSACNLEQHCIELFNFALELVACAKITARALKTMLLSVFGMLLQASDTFRQVLATIRLYVYMVYSNVLKLP